MLSAHLDESGIHEGAQVCVVCGFFGGENQWKKADRQWKEILDRYGIAEFHSKDFWGRDEKSQRVGAYKSWSDDKANKFLSSLVGVVETNVVYPVSSAIVVPDFYSSSHDERRFLTGGLYFKNKFRSSGAPSKPYFVPFQHCITESAKYCKPGIQINYYFDFNKEFKNYAVDLYSMLKNLAAAQRDPISKALGNIEFPTGLQAPALQTADLLAYQTYQYCKVRITNTRVSQEPLETAQTNF